MAPIITLTSRLEKGTSTTHFVFLLLYFSFQLNVIKDIVTVWTHYAVKDLETIIT